jgi:hypothetical protein
MVQRRYNGDRSAGLVVMTMLLLQTRQSLLSMF